MDRIPQEPLEASMPPSELVEMTRHQSIGHQKSNIQRFYNGQNIFITGGTGFVGKLLMEKLLRSCPDIQTIYLLVRVKKGKDMHTRIDEMFDDPIFDKLKKESSKFRHKVVGICGDCAITGLGLSINDRRRLIEDVNIVFHAAATVRFDEHLRLALAINVHATRDILQLSRQMIHLKAIVHVSTAYSNCHLKQIDEIFYNTPFQMDHLELMVSKLNDQQLQELTPKILGQWPNTYAFTKALAENEIVQHCKGLPIGVFRPAIVVSTYKEPLVGWVNNVYGPNGVVAGVCKGVLRTLYCDKDALANIVPADMCVNALICSAWDVANKSVCRSKDDVKIYNYVSVEKQITWEEFNSTNIIYAKKYPFSDTYWSLNFRTNNNYIINQLYFIVLHYLPALIIDIVLLLFGKKPHMFNLYRKIQKFSDVLAPFCTQDWYFINTNVQILWKKLDINDRKLFNFNMADLDWLDFFKHYIKGMRVHLFKDPLSNLEQAKIRYQRLEKINNILSLICNFLFFYLIMSLFKYVFYYLNIF